MSGNPWSKDCDGKGHTHRYFVIRLLPTVKEVDGMGVDDHEKASPARGLGKGWFGGNMACVTWYTPTTRAGPYTLAMFAPHVWLV